MLFGVPLPAHRRQALARRARALPTCPHAPLRPPARQRLCAQCSRHSDSSHPHRVRVPRARDPSLRRPLPFLQNGARFRPEGRSR